MPSGAVSIPQRAGRLRCVIANVSSGRVNVVLHAGTMPKGAMSGPSASTMLAVAVAARIAELLPYMTEGPTRPAMQSDRPRSSVRASIASDVSVGL